MLARDVVLDFMFVYCKNQPLFLQCLPVFFGVFNTNTPLPGRENVGSFGFDKFDPCVEYHYI